MNKFGGIFKSFLLVTLLLVFLIPMHADFAATNIQFPDINISVSGEDGDVEVANSIQILVLLTVLSLAPSILIMMTSFTRFIIVLGFVRRALSLQATPPNQTLIGLALFLTLFVMQPVLTDVYENAYVPLQEGTVTLEEATELASGPFKEFMLSQVRSKDLALFLNIANVEEVNTNDDISMTVLIPAFVLSELKLSFEIGFLIFMPFIVVDMIVASTLMALGMMMLPPVMISLPIKILLFILVDGWHLIIEKLILSIRYGVKMNEEMIIDLFSESIKVILVLSAPMLLSGLLIGLVIAIFQATTQIQESTLAFVPKIIVVFVVMLVTGSWMIKSLVEYTNYVLNLIDVIIY